MTRTRKPTKAATAATKAAPRPAGFPKPPAPNAATKPAPAATKPAGMPTPAPRNDDDRDALAVRRDALLREAFSLTSDDLFDLANITRALEKAAADDVAAAQAAQADTAPN